MTSHLEKYTFSIVQQEIVIKYLTNKRDNDTAKPPCRDQNVRYQQILENVHEILLAPETLNNCKDYLQCYLCRKDCPGVYIESMSEQAYIVI